jgi:uncharacterized protein
LAKLLLIIGVTIFIVWLLKGGRRNRSAAPRSEGRSAEDMVRCQVCGVNLPRSEALMSRGRFYCCDEHRRKDA